MTKSSNFGIIQEKDIRTELFYPSSSLEEDQLIYWISYTPQEETELDVLQENLCAFHQYLQKSETATRVWRKIQGQHINCVFCTSETAAYYKEKKGCSGRYGNYFSEEFYGLKLPDFDVPCKYIGVFVPLKYLKKATQIFVHENVHAFYDVFLTQKCANFSCNTQRSAVALEEVIASAQDLTFKAECMHGKRPKKAFVEERVFFNLLQENQNKSFEEVGQKFIQLYLGAPTNPDIYDFQERFISQAFDEPLINKINALDDTPVIVDMIGQFYQMKPQDISAIWENSFVRQVMACKSLDQALKVLGQTYGKEQSGKNKLDTWQNLSLESSKIKT